MKRLWTPWRMDYIKSTNSKDKCGCVFCKKQKMDNDEAHIIHRKSTCYSILNKYPYTNGHILVAPYRHISKLDSLSKKELTELIMLVRECQGLLFKVFKPQGFNIGLNLGRAAGAGIAGHLHFHVVGRWVGDTNFMPVMDNVRLIPQSLDETYQLFKSKVKIKKKKSGQ